MIPGLMTHLWQSTLLVGAAWLLTLALRKDRAHVRYWVWFAASAKFLLPFSSLPRLGALAPPHTAMLVPPAWADAFVSIGESLLVPPAVVTASGTEGNHLTAVALSLWAAGFAAITICWLVRWLRACALRRAANPINMPHNTNCVPVMSCPSLVEPGVFGIVRPVLLLPEGIGECLSQAQLEAILAHELCHVRRRDNLTSAIHMVVQAVFWFHPLVWWLGARLLDERERACDEEVLRLGNRPWVYAEGILIVCKRYVESPLACVSGVTGANLKQRIQRIMTPRIARGLSPARKLLLAGAALLAVAGPVIVGMLSESRLSAQPSNIPIVATPSGPKFEVASIKPALAKALNYGIKIDAGRVSIGSWSIRQLILRAYGLPSYRLSAPGWIAELRFDVDAKFPEGTSRDRLPEMLQWLLADRFGLVAHVETKDLPGFALLVGKAGLKIEPADPSLDAPPESPSPNRLEHSGQLMDRLASNDPKAFGVVSMKPLPGLLRVEFKRLPVEALAQILADRLQAPVINLTGLAGDYHLTLDLPASPNSAASPAEQLQPSLFSTVEQLGLKLEKRKTPISLLVVDRVNRAPTEN